MLFKQAELYNVVELVETEDREGFYISRLPSRVRSQINKAADSNALNPCGCEVRFCLVGESATISLRREPALGLTLETGIAEVFHGCFQGSYQSSPQPVGCETVSIVVTKPDQMARLEKIAAQNNHPFDPNVVRVILPYDWKNRLVDIQGDITPPLPSQIPTVRYLAYGSSITHGSCAASPSETYAMRTARLLGADLINMGFAGSAKLDEAMAEYIASRTDWTFASMELGINVLGEWTVEEFEQRADAFTRIMRTCGQERHVFWTDLFTTGQDYEGDSKGDAFRNVIRTKIEASGMPNWHYRSGLELLTSSHGLTVDLVHPSSVGMEDIANQLTAWMKPLVQFL
ncbi:MAG: hypothetical protein H7X86_00275 [Gorillibacterium sp.]|nr:hypothetical protein [Gorillibacterium sp.]